MILVFSLVSSFVYISRKKITYWEKLGVVQPKEVSLLFGNTKDAVLQRIHFGVLCRRLYNELDGLRFGGFYHFSKPILLLRDPVLIKAVLVENFPHFHDRHDAKLLNERLDPLTCHLVNLSGQRFVISCNFNTSLVGPLTASRSKPLKLFAVQNSEALRASRFM